MNMGWQILMHQHTSSCSHSHEVWSPGVTAAIALGFVALGVVAAGGMVVLRRWFRKASADLRPCPGCGTFIAPDTECPSCSGGSGSRLEDDR